VMTRSTKWSRFWPPDDLVSTSCGQTLTISNGLTHPVDTSNLEPEGPTGVIGAVQVVAHGKDDVEQFLEQLGVAQVEARGCQ